MISKCLRTSACIRRKYPDTHTKIHVHYQSYFKFVFIKLTSLFIIFNIDFVLDLSSNVSSSNVAPRKLEMREKRDFSTFGPL